MTHEYMTHYHHHYSSVAHEVKKPAFNRFPRLHINWTGARRRVVDAFRSHVKGSATVLFCVIFKISVLIINILTYRDAMLVDSIDDNEHECGGST